MGGQEFDFYMAPFFAGFCSFFRLGKLTRESYGPFSSTSKCTVCCVYPRCTFDVCVSPYWCLCMDTISNSSLSVSCAVSHTMSLSIGDKEFSDDALRVEPGHILSDTVLNVSPDGQCTTHCLLAAFDVKQH